MDHWSRRSDSGERVGYGLVSVLRSVLVDQGGTRAPLASTSHQLFCGGPRGSGPREPAVPEVVQVKVSSLGSLSRIAPYAVEVARGQARPRRGTKEPRGRFRAGKSLKVLLDGWEDVRRDGEHPDACFRLRRSNRRLAAHRDRPCLLDRDPPMEQINMLALESEHLTPAQVTPGAEQDGEPVSLRDRFNCGRQLGQGCDGTLRRADLPGTFDLAWTLEHQTVGNGGVEDSSKQAVGVVSGDEVRQAKCRILVPNGTRQESAHLKATERRKDVVAEEVTILADR